VGQRRVSDESNEIPALPDLLAPMDLDGALITADAMHTRRSTAQWIISRGAHYALTVKDMPAGPEAGAGEAALEGRALHLRPRRLPRAQGAAHHQSGRGARPGRLPRRRPGRSTTSDLDRARKASSRVASPVWVVTNLVALGASPTGDDRRARFSDASLCGGNSHGALGVEKEDAHRLLDERWDTDSEHTGGIPS